ncbi:transcription initiation factor IIE subunit alpha family protein [Halorussus halobius]|nr:hypothetical protein [Halorussus halobius]
MSGQNVCPACDTPYSDGDYRCERCGKDLVEVDTSAPRTAGWWA